MATALSNDDYVNLSNIASKYETYCSAISQYMTRQEEVAEGEIWTYYQLPSSVGTILLQSKDTPSYGVTTII